MVIDTSVIVAILLGEPEAEAFAAAIDADQSRLLSAANALEIYLVIARAQREEGVRELDLFLMRAQIELVPFDNEQYRFAREAFRRFGKGRHPAALNFGDCFAYALSVASGEPLLFKGNDFSRTDVRAVTIG